MQLARRHTPQQRCTCASDSPCIPFSTPELRIAVQAGCDNLSASYDDVIHDVPGIKRLAGFCSEILFSFRQLIGWRTEVGQRQFSTWVLAWNGQERLPTNSQASPTPREDGRFRYALCLPGSNLNLIQLAYTLSCVAFDHLPGFTPLRSRLFRFLRVSLAVQVRGHGACGTPAAGDTLP